MDRGITIIISIVVGVAAMGGVAIFGFDVLSGSTVGTNLVPKTLDVISSNTGKSIQVSVVLNNQGSGSIASVGAVLRANVMEICGPSVSGDEVDCEMTPSMPKGGVIYFPIYYSETVVDSYKTINIRGSIESDGPPVGGKVSSGYGCNEELDTNGQKLAPEAGFTSLDDAINYFKADDLKIAKAGGNGAKATDKVMGSGTGVTVGENNVVCASNLGIFAGEQMILTVIATTTSGDTIEKVLEITAR